MASSNASSLKTGDKDEEDRAAAKRSAIDDDIVKTQSCLFRLFVTDRMSTEWSFVHPIICQLVKSCERLNEAHEYLSDAAEQMKKKRATRRRTTNGNGTGTGQWLGVNGEDDSEPIANSASQPIPANSLQQQQSNNATTSSSSLPSLSTSRAGTPIETLMDPDRLLTNLIRLCRRVINLCDSFGLSSDTVVDTLLLFLGIFESFETTLWKTTTGISYPCFQILKKRVFEKLRGILNAISTCILIEVQYS
ncbi:hypothetical protein BDR26DRAFT_897186 [Obelidium mucronatum]|nr:hypothetical protein BDR26DRAFT_897186 [Obelidium mucronatum]